MPVPARRLKSGTIWVGTAQPQTSGCTVIYARVSSDGQRADLDRQVARLTLWATSNGHEVGEVVTEVGSKPEWEASKVAVGAVGPGRERGSCGAP